MPALALAAHFTARVLEIRQPAVGRPHPVHHDGVDPARHKDGVSQVGVEVEALSHAAGRDGGGGGCECPLKELRGRQGAAEA